MPFEMLQAMLYRTFVELAEGTKEASPLPGASALPLSLPRKAVTGLEHRKSQRWRFRTSCAKVLLLLDAVAPPLPPLGPSGATARHRWWELRARLSLPPNPTITWMELANELDNLLEAFSKTPVSPLSPEVDDEERLDRRDLLEFERRLFLEDAAAWEIERTELEDKQAQLEGEVANALREAEEAAERVNLQEVQMEMWRNELAQAREQEEEVHYRASMHFSLRQENMW
eukprot:g3390.t1